MTTVEPTITPLIVPVSLAADDAADFRACAALNRQICDELVGLPDLASTAEQMLPGWQDQTDALHRGFVARIDGQIVGMITIYIALEDEAHAIEFDLLVPREHWEQGIGCPARAGRSRGAGT